METQIVEHNYLNPNRNVDPTSLRWNLLQLINGGRNELKAFYRRPGMGTAVIDLSITAPTDGHYWWDKNKIGIKVCAGRIWKYNQSYVTTELTSGTAVLETRGQCTFTEVKKTSTGVVYLCIANGGRVVITDGTTVTVLTGADDPVNCTHVLHVDGYLIANDISTEEKKNQWFAALLNDPTTFTGGNTYTAPMQVDDIIALVEVNRQVYVLGTETVEPWYNQGATIPFARVNGGLRNYGTFSKDSVTTFQDDIYLFTNKREVARIRNYNIEVLSKPYNNLIQNLTTIDDVKIEIISSFGGKDWLKIDFPSEDLTLVYDINLNESKDADSKEWYEWSYWSSSSHTQFLGTNHIYAVAWGKHLIGDRTSGKIYEFSASNDTDRTSTVRQEIITGHINHGTNKTKISVCLKIWIKRGMTATGKSIFLYWRDDGNTEWGSAAEIELDTGSLGDREVHVELRPMGQYQSRQYKWVFADAADFVLTNVEEEVGVLAR